MERECRTCMWLYHMVTYNPTAPCSTCLDHDKWQTTKKTHYDEIRAMNIEELAEWLDGNFRRADWCDQSKFPNGDCMEVPCLGCIINWLKQEVSDG